MFQMSTPKFSDITTAAEPHLAGASLDGLLNRSLSIYSAFRSLPQDFGMFPRDSVFL